LALGSRQHAEERCEREEDECQTPHRCRLPIDSSVEA